MVETTGEIRKHRHPGKGQRRGAPRPKGRQLDTAALEEVQLASLPASAWSPPLGIETDAPPEILIQSAGGRYLWIRIEMFGDGARTPRIASVDVPMHRTSSPSVGVCWVDRTIHCSSRTTTWAPGAMRDNSSLGVRSGNDPPGLTQLGDRY